MKRILAVFSLLALATAMAQSATQWLLSYQSFKSRYAIYSGGLSDPQPPTRKDKRIAF